MLFALIGTNAMCPLCKEQKNILEFPHDKMQLISLAC